ncbi:hypothetical protein GIW54_19520 [Pseudomonas proteolytica]|uniref:DUF502 domain-containing protein n=1 Tax=Pseudomonas proteolytica TaxID=219574 RepID=A0AAW5ACE1_9PSED|nr:MULTISPECIES: hypothetical protein [Pseudomonas]AIG04114.1 hypothetical protein HZ99_18720 [Pseudomonas fluorescens]MBJ2250630.1 hypothetical protein [Pseudomonas sp. MF6784]MCF5060350.1 hypothetical protein [Pseudomonas proteolytica]MCF5102916.1 hypothetical protein [Pseudomonas proteolytica]
MRQIWELFRVLWIVGSLPVGALLLVVVVLCGFNLPFFLGFSGGADPAIRWLFWALAFYFVGGGWLFWRVNQRYAEKLKQLVAGFQNAGFQPQLEVFAKINDAYLGIDGSARRLLAYPVKGAEHFFRFDEINSWRIVPVGKHNHRLEVLTSNLDVPVFSLVLKPTEVLNTEARLDTLLGT